MYKSESIEELAASIAHEIKNPLSLVRANIDLLELADKEGAYSKNYRVMRNELEKISEMTGYFLDFTKAERQSFDVVYLYDAIEEALENYKCSVGGTYEIDCDDRDIAVWADEKSIGRVISNAIKNSLEAAGDSAIIKISLYAEGNASVLKIKDNGSGIPVDIIDSIGNVFFTTKKNGNGLGVAICKKIVSQCGGVFKLENAEDGGCLTTIKLPLAR
jgi:signal transduction histidine kinase